MYEQHIKRAKNLILSPKAEWQVIDGEPVDIAALYKHWVIPLAVIPALAGFIGSSIVGTGAVGMPDRVPFFTGVFNALIQVVLTLANVFVFAHVISFMAPCFGAQKNLTQALKLAAYMPVAAWLLGIFLAIPSLSVLALAGEIYALYLLYVGLPVLMNPAKDKAVAYTASMIIASAILSLVFAQITQAMRPHHRSGAYTPDQQEQVQENQGKALEKASKNGDLGGMLAALSGGSVTIVTDLDALEKLAPARLGGLKRTDIGVENLDAPIKAIRLKAVYEGTGGQLITLSVVNSPAVNFLKTVAGMAGASRSIKKPDGSFESLVKKTHTLIMQNWNAKTARGTYAWSYKNFIVSVDGKDVSPKALKKASTVISPEDLDRLPKG